MYNSAHDIQNLLYYHHIYAVHYTHLHTHTHTHTSFPTGQSGLGKSTLINSLFMTDIYEDSTYPDPVVRMPQTTQVRSYVKPSTLCLSLLFCACFLTFRCASVLQNIVRASLLFLSAFCPCSPMTAHTLVIGREGILSVIPFFRSKHRTYYAYPMCSDTQSSLARDKIL